MLGDNNLISIPLPFRTRFFTPVIVGAVLFISGSSNYFWGSLVTYSNIAKHKILGIKEEILEDYGAVSKEVALGMAASIMELSDSEKR